MFFFYRIITFLTYPILILLIFVRKLRKKEDQKRYKEKIFTSYFKSNRDSKFKLIWFHAASIGELKSIIPIINDLKKEKKNLQFLITTLTLSSSNLAKDIFKNNKHIFHRFFPLDIEFLQNSFLDTWKPNAVFLVDSEIWPNMIWQVKKRGIPIAIINARITNKTFNKWMMIPKSAKKIFNSFKLCLTSSLETKDYLLKLNAQKVLFCGNIKLIKNSNDKVILDNKNEDILSKLNFWCAVSTHKKEEEFCINVHNFLRKKYKKVITIIAPRHIERSNEIEKICDENKISCQILSKNDLISNNKEVIIINSFGILPSFFKHSRSVFMGKSLMQRFESNGGQNPIEAARLGCKIYHGPYVYNFKEIYEIFKKYGISKKIETVEYLADNLIKDFQINKENSLDLSKRLDNLSKKIFEDTMKNINQFLKDETK